MFPELLDELTPQQRRALEDEFAVTRNRIHEWRHGKGYPTEVQTGAIAVMTGVSYAALQAEITLKRANDRQRGTLERVLGKLLVGAAGCCVALGLGGAPTAGAKGTDRADVSTVNRRRLTALRRRFVNCLPRIRRYGTA